MRSAVECDCTIGCLNTYAAMPIVSGLAKYSEHHTGLFTVTGVELFSCNLRQLSLCVRLFLMFMHESVDVHWHTADLYTRYNLITKSNGGRYRKANTIRKLYHRLTNLCEIYIFRLKKLTRLHQHRQIHFIHFLVKTD
jgi:hypothetical protein